MMHAAKSLIQILSVVDQTFMFLSFQVRWTAPAEMTPCIDGYQVKASFFPPSYSDKQCQNADNNAMATITPYHICLGGLERELGKW